MTHPPTFKPEPTHDSSDRGFSLVEMITTITLMGLAVLPLLLAAFVLVKSSVQATEAAKVEVVVRDVADRVNRALPSCDYQLYADTAAQQEQELHLVAAVNHKRYVPGPTADVAGTWVDGACDAATPTKGLVQLVTVSISTPDGKLSRTIQVVKSDI